MEKLKQLVEGRIPPWVHRLFRRIIKADMHFGLFSSEKICLGISGGKDSLALAFCLAMLKKFYGLSLDVYPVLINWKQYAISPEKQQKLDQFFAAIGQEFYRIDASLYDDGDRENFDCYSCARARKGHIFRAAENIGASLIAYGHHLDDFIETNLMNLLLRGKLEVMQPRQSFFNGKFSVIRPLCLVPEFVLHNLSVHFDFPVYHIDCPFKDSNQRIHIKKIIRELFPVNKHIRTHLFEAYSSFYHKKTVNPPG